MVPQFISHLSHVLIRPYRVPSTFAASTTQTRYAKSVVYIMGCVYDRIQLTSYSS